MEVIRLVEQKILSVTEKVLGVLLEGVGFQDFEAQLKKELDQLGVDVLQVVLEALDQKLLNSKSRKQEWGIVRRNDPKELLIPFGQLSYTRTYYRHKESREYSHLVDAKARITPHSRISTNMKADLTAACGESSYEQATRQLSSYNPALKVSRQTACICVKGFHLKPCVPLKDKRRVDTLYIERSPESGKAPF